MTAGSWAFDTVCKGCRHWRANHPNGTCGRCRRHELPTRRRLCRGCILHIAECGPEVARQSSVQPGVVCGRLVQVVMSRLGVCLWWLVGAGGGW